MTAFSNIIWDNPDIWGIVVGRGIATVEAATMDSCEEWLKNNGYSLLSFNFLNGISPVIARLGEYFCWQEQFGYSLDPQSRNLAALRDGFEIEAPNVVLALQHFEHAWSENEEWSRGFLSIVSDHSLRRLAVGERFFAILPIQSIESELIGQTIDDIYVPSPFRFRYRAT
ncbi:hypothetical protein GCM10027296_23660 [Chitinimonas naiadis]